MQYTSEYTSTVKDQIPLYTMGWTRTYQFGGKYCVMPAWGPRNPRGAAAWQCFETSDHHCISYPINHMKLSHFLCLRQNKCSSLLSCLVGIL